MPGYINVELPTARRRRQCGAAQGEPGSREIIQQYEQPVSAEVRINRAVQPADAHESGGALELQFYPQQNLAVLPIAIWRGQVIFATWRRAALGEMKMVLPGRRELPASNRSSCACCQLDSSRPVDIHFSFSPRRALLHGRANSPCPPANCDCRTAIFWLR